MQVLQKHILTVLFKDIEVGQPFRFDDKIFLCIPQVDDKHYDEMYNAVNLESGCLYEFTDCDVVEPVHAIVEEID